MAPVESIDSHEWLGKAEAAELLGVSPRQIERRAGEGVIAKRTLPRAKGEATARVVYSRADLEALKAGSPNQALVPSPVSNDVELEKPTLALEKSSNAGSPGELVDAVQSLGASIVAAMQPPRPWLTLSEAVEYSGLPRAFLRREASRGADCVLNVGSDKAPRWRFNRDALSRPV